MCPMCYGSLGHFFKGSFVAYQVIARKFRPQSFNDFVGQSHVTQTLQNALASDRFPHALLLTGPRGTGKTTTARIIAKTILCQNPQDQNPCGECQSCKDITEGKHLDVIEIDGASNNGVDHIRELRDTIGYMPSSGKYKVYIIDEVHMLSVSAFNALLKTLEEPPDHVIFIFATTEVQKIPATILSRCQRFDFRNHTLQDIKNNLQKICEQENIKFEDSALLTIAKQANGSIRDSLTLLDQMISFSKGKLTLDSVMGVLGLTDRHLLLSCLKAVAENNSDLMFETIKSFKNTGYDARLFAEEFLELIRNCLLVRKGCHKQQSLDIPEFEISELEKIAPSLTEEMIHLLFDVTLSGVQRLNYSSDAHLALEMLLFKLLSLPRLTQSLPMDTPNTSTKSRPQPSSGTTAKAQTKPQEKAQPRTETKPQSNKEVAQDLTQALIPPTKPEESKSKSASTPIPNPSNEVGKTWEEFVHAVKQTNGFLGALLEHTSIYKEDDKIIYLGLPSKMSFLQDKLNDPKNIERTENFLEAFWSDKRKIEVELLGKSQEQESLSPKAKEEQARKQKEKRESDSVEAHPLVKAAEEVFKDNISKVGVTNSPAPKM